MPAPLPFPAAIETIGAVDSVAEIGNAATPLLAIDLRGATRHDAGADAVDAAVETLTGAPWVTVVVVDDDLHHTVHDVADAADIVLTETSAGPTGVVVGSAEAEVERLQGCVTASPRAAVALVQLLRLAEGRTVEQALHAESLTYGLLQTGDTFRAWLDQRRAARPAAHRPADVSDRRVVTTRRDGGLLTITLDRAHRRNALDVAMRDQLCEALQLLDLDASLDGAVLRGAGPNFCAGGDLDEFGTTPSAATGHHVRTVRSLPRLVHRVRSRLRVHLHGTCVGAGIEMPAFAHAVVAHPDTTFRLPEVGFGLVPGAGGTVSVSRRSSRHRTAWWAITGETIDANQALRWNLIDRIDASIEPAPGSG